MLQAGAQIALAHHQKFDGKGYPIGSKGKDIPTFSHKVAVADVFDALTPERTYKKVWSLEQASQHLKANSGSRFDPECGAIFFKEWDTILLI